MKSFRSCAPEAFFSCLWIYPLTLGLALEVAFPVEAWQLKALRFLSGGIIFFLLTTYSLMRTKE